LTAEADWPDVTHLHITPHLPPVLILHGDADTLVPLSSPRFVARAREGGGTTGLAVRHGNKHGWPTMPGDIRQFADWFGPGTCSRKRK
jgi:acetyl esterase/lipase